MNKLIQEALAASCETLLRKRAVLRITGLSNSSFYKRIKEGVIPRGVPIGPRLKGWPASEIEAYVQSCIAQRDGQQNASSQDAVCARATRDDSIANLQGQLADVYGDREHQHGEAA